MSRWRLATLITLTTLPFVFLLGAGGYYLWTIGWSSWFWWPMTGCLALAYFLGWRWQRKFRLLRLDFTAPVYWTDRDKQAWQLVEARAKAAAELPAAKLSDINIYWETAQEMALELARFYHPKAQDPVGSLTIPELLAVVELAAHDLTGMVDQYLPAGHLLTVNDWRLAKKASDWYQTASNVYWIISSLFSPINTALRYGASRVGLSRPLQLLQQNLLLWFYSAYIHRLGNYLIELNSGRLRVGATRYRQLQEQFGTGAAQSDPPSPAEDNARDSAAERADPAIRQVTITIVGQVKTGKSSFINALLGEQLARTAVVPMTSEITRFELQPEGISHRLVLLDTVGYNQEGPTLDQLASTQEAARTSDLLVLVLHATNPARQADVKFLTALAEWFDQQPELKKPPLLGVLTHIDLLSPKMEWAPPYDWLNPTRAKEIQIDQAVATVREQLGTYLAGVVPVCTAAEKTYGIDEWFLPSLVKLLDEARAVAFLRSLRGEMDTGKIRKVLSQLLLSGKTAVKILWEAAKSKK